jgi:hypothetical protein
MKDTVEYIGLLVLAAVGVVVIVGCTKDPVSTTYTNNPEVPVSVLFEYDGCKMYRFADDGRHHYYAKCENAKVQTENSHTESCGKNCTRTVEDNIFTE